MSSALDLAKLGDLLRGRRLAVLTGAGCSTDSGIPDYRGPNTPPRKRPPIQHREFVDDPAARRRYWARSVVGWPVLAQAEPNAVHRSLAELEHAGIVTGLITQNVDGLHARAGSTSVELHGAIRRVRCLACGALSSRDALQEQLLALNPRYRAFVGDSSGGSFGELRPDGDVEIDDDVRFEIVACAQCGGVLMPDVVFFGGNVPRDTLDDAWAAFDRGEVLLVLGSSLSVFSGYRFVRRAVERGMPVAIVNRGPTRGDAEATLRLDASLGPTLDHLKRELQ